MKPTINVRILSNNLPRLKAAAPDKADRGLRVLADSGVSYTKLSFGTSPAPSGGPPGVDTGTLRATIRWEKIGNLLYAIMDGVLYGVILEFGSTRHGYIWPFMGPMAFWLEGQVEGVFQNWLD